LTDEFAKDVSDAQTLEELRKKMRDSLEGGAHPIARMSRDARKKLLAQIVKAHEFPVPEALVEHQMGISRLETHGAVTGLPKAVDPRAGECGLGPRCAAGKKDRSVEDVEGGVCCWTGLPRRKKIDVSDEEVEKEIAAIAEAQWRIGHRPYARTWTRQGAPG